MKVDPVTVHRGEGFHVFPMVQLQADLGGLQETTGTVLFEVLLKTCCIQSVEVIAILQHSEGC